MMDRSLKERTIGAIVLVAFAVLVVPVFLDGPSGDGETITAAVTLPGQNDQPRKQQTIVLERDRTEPVPRPAETSPEPLQQPRQQPQAEAKAPVQTASVPKPSPQEAKKTPASAAKVAPASVAAKETPASREPAAAKPAAASATGMWAVQLGSFSNRANAEKLAADLRGDGYAAFLSQLGTASGELHRVRIGPQKDRDSAETVAAKLGKSGHKGQVVPHP